MSQPATSSNVFGPAKSMGDPSKPSTKPCEAPCAITVFVNMEGGGMVRITAPFVLRDRAAREQDATAVRSGVLDARVIDACLLAHDTRGRPSPGDRARAQNRPLTLTPCGVTAARTEPLPRRRSMASTVMPTPASAAPTAIIAAPGHLRR